jgi:hypothetical protein
MRRAAVRTLDGDSGASPAVIPPGPRRVSATVSRLAPAPAKALLPADADYWLGHCEEFQVDGPAGSVGVVEAVSFDPRLGRPDLIVVRRSGPHRLRAAEVPVASVVEIHSAERRLVLDGHW